MHDKEESKCEGVSRLTIHDGLVFANLQHRLEILRTEVGNTEGRRDFTLILHVLKDLPATRRGISVNARSAEIERSGM